MPISLKHWGSALNYQHHKCLNTLPDPASQPPNSTVLTHPTTFQYLRNRTDMAFTPSTYPYLTTRIFSYEETGLGVATAKALIPHAKVAQRCGACRVRLTLLPSKEAQNQ